MASRSTITLVDDLDGTSAEESVAFGLDGATYEIDLSETNAVRLRDAVALYIASARRTGGRRAAATRPASSSAASRSVSDGAVKRSTGENQAIRAWAVEHGAFVPARGRIPGLLVTAYEANDPSLLPAAASTATDSAPAPSAPPVEPVVEPAPRDGAQTAPANADERSRGRDGLAVSEREQVRAWALGEGIDVKTRGQLKKDLIANYQATTARR